VKSVSLPSYNNAHDELKVQFGVVGCDVSVHGIWELSAAIHLSRLKTHHHHHNHLTIKVARGIYCYMGEGA
jgi:hypothetical protein